jgi:hypothetical protein
VVAEIAVAVVLAASVAEAAVAAVLVEVGRNF